MYGGSSSSGWKVNTTGGERKKKPNNQEKWCHHSRNLRNKRTNSLKERAMWRAAWELQPAHPLGGASWGTFLW
jgi:hypothetical protein